MSRQRSQGLTPPRARFSLAFENRAIVARAWLGVPNWWPENGVNGDPPLSISAIGGSVLAGFAILEPHRAPIATFDAVICSLGDCVEENSNEACARAICHMGPGNA